MVSGFQACNFYNSPRACRLGTSERRSTNQLCLVGLYSWQLTQVNTQVTQLEVRKVRNVFKLHQLNLHNVFFAEKAPKSALSRWLGVEVHRRKKPIMLITACRVHEASTNSKQAQGIHYLVTMSSGCFKGECSQRRMQMCHTHSSHAPKRKGKVKGNKHMNLLKKLVRVPISFKTQCSDCTTIQWNIVKLSLQPKVPKEARAAGTWKIACIYWNLPRKMPRDRRSAGFAPEAHLQICCRASAVRVDAPTTWRELPIKWSTP